ncbi:hypothetical protein H4R19_003872, partial [Coemansia spiralis]
ISGVWEFVRSLQSATGKDAAGLDLVAQDAPGLVGGLVPLAIALVANGAIAFVLNIASFTANKNTSALAMTVAGNVKVVLTVILGCMLFNVSLSSLSTLGIAVTVAGGAAYSFVRLHEAQEAKKRTKTAA